MGDGMVANPDLGQNPDIIKYTPLTISASGTTSDAANTFGNTPIALYMPGAFTGTALTFLVSHDGSAWVTAQKDGEDYTEEASASQMIPLDPQVMAGVNHLKVVSNGTEAAQRVIQLACRPV